MDGGMLAMQLENAANVSLLSELLPSDMYRGITEREGREGLRPHEQALSLDIPRDASVQSGCYLLLIFGR